MKKKGQYFVRDRGTVVKFPIYLCCWVYVRKRKSRPLFYAKYNQKYISGVNLYNANTKMIKILIVLFQQSSIH